MFYFQSFSIFVQLFFETTPRKQLKCIIKKHPIFKTIFRNLFRNN